jgi:8-oxo-dGTP pyrophosphatase MutT (NUDIX family)
MSSDKQDLPLQEVVIIIIEKENKFLFQKNPKWHDLSFIGGKVDPPDKTPLDAAYRECGEELAIKKDIDYSLEPIEPFLIEDEKMSKRTGKITLYRFHIFKMNMKRDITKQLNAEENVWLEKRDIKNPSSDTQLSEIVQTIFPILDL